MGQFPRGSSQEGWENKAVFGSQGPELSNSERTLPSSSHRGHSNLFAQSQGVHKTYWWKCMPFGIRPAPEIFQRRIHKLIEGMPHVEVVANDFVVVGYGETRASDARA